MEQVNPGNEVSRIGVQFGEDFDGDGKCYFKFTATINKQASNEQMQKISEMTSNQIEVPWSLILAFSVSPQNKSELLQTIQKLSTPPDENSQDVLHQQLYQEISQGKFEIKSCEAAGKVFVQLKPTGDFSQAVQEPFEMFFGMGLDQLSDQQKNVIEFSLSSNNSISDILNQMQSGERILAAILASSKLEFKASLDTKLGDKVKEVVANFDPEFANSPPLVFLKYFKNLDVDARFNSANDLPENIRKKILFGKKLQEGSPEQLQLNPQFSAVMTSLINTIDADVDIYFTIPDFAAFQLSAHAPALSAFIQQYGGSILNM